MRRRTRRATATLGVLTATLLVAAAAGAQVSSNMILYSNLDEHAEYNDIWGYTAPNGDEYALLGVNNGLAVINVSDPANPYETGFISGPTSIWRDIKTYGQYAYVTTEAGGGLDIVDLSDPENPVGLPNYTGFSSAHNLYIDTSTGYCYIAGSNLSNGGLRILSLANPTSPAEVGSWETAYLHDVMVQNGKAYCGAINAARLYVLDVSNPFSITVLGTASGYPRAFTHNAWVTPDDQFVMTTDELTGAACRMWDVSSLPTITQTDFYLPNASTIPHNTHIEGNLAIISHYSIGVRIVDISDPYNLAEVGYYDTFAPNDGGGYDGCWGTFPYFDTSPDLIVVSDIQTGLWVFEYRPLGTLSGRVTDLDAGGAPVAGATVEIVETGMTATTDGAGDYSLEDGAGNVTLRVSGFGYVTADYPVAIAVGSTTIQDAALVHAPGGSVGGIVTASGGGAIAGASVELVGTPASVVTDGSGVYLHDPVPVGSYTVRAWAFGYDSVDSPISVTAGQSANVDIELTPAVLADDFEVAVIGWNVSGNATTGQWERADPQPTDGGTVQTGDDHTPAPGVNAWITGPLAGASVGTHDVDNGQTILKSPYYNLEGLSDPQVSYWRWYVTGYSGNSTTDFWTVEMSTNAGSSWITIENTDESTAEWVNIRFAVSDFGTPGAYTQFRFTARDTGAGSITEAGIDDLTVYDLGDLSETGIGPSPGPASALTFGLGRGTPNPFRAGAGTTLEFTLPVAGPIEAAVYDVAGRRVQVLADGDWEPGRWALQWNGNTGAGRAAPAGVYFVKLRSGQGVRTQKMVLIR